MSKARSLLVVAGAYVLAIAVAAAWLCWGPSTDRVSRFVPWPRKGAVS
jgi:cytochrome b